LSWHIEWALKNGLRCEEIEAIVRVIAPYVGYPKASVAMELVRNIVKGKER
jgi:alkylhydroperoxidase/carboxymuconolactone decarboxylase family protein YurZ